VPVRRELSAAQRTLAVLDAAHARAAGALEGKADAVRQPRHRRTPLTPIPARRTPPFIGCGYDFQRTSGRWGRHFLQRAPNQGLGPGSGPPTEAVDGLLESRPQALLYERVRAGELESVGFVDIDPDLPGLVADNNEQITTARLITRRSFSDAIEKSRSRTSNQERSCVSTTRLQDFAAACSAKTSVIVAPAAYSSRLLQPRGRRP
jgi:hypothetical protein